MPFVGYAKVVANQVYTNPAFPGRKVSFFGAHPAGEGWQVTPDGFSIRWEDGTRGICKPPFKTREDADKWAEDYNAKLAARYAAAIENDSASVRLR